MARKKRSSATKPLVWRDDPTLPGGGYWRADDDDARRFLVEPDPTNGCTHASAQLGHRCPWCRSVVDAEAVAA